MRHGKRINHLGRTASHRKAMLSNMAASLLVHKRINTTLAKAKELRKYVEPLITKAKNDTTHTRRVVFSYLQDKESVNALFNEVVDRVADRPGGYTRIIKLGSRLGDNAEMAMIELVDFNDLLIQEAEPKKAKTRRSRRGSKGKETAAITEVKEEKKEKVEELGPTTEKAEAKAEEITEKPEETEAVENEPASETKAEKTEEINENKTDDKHADELKTKEEEETETPSAKADEEKESKEKENKDSGESEDKK